MKVFYWTEPVAEYPRRFMQVDPEGGFGVEIPGHQIGPVMLKELLEDGFTEITTDTAYKLGLPT